MKYNRVHLGAIGYELPPVVVSTAELESRLSPVYQALKMAPGQLELLTGINERRWWEPGYPLSQGAAAAAKNCRRHRRIDLRRCVSRTVRACHRLCSGPRTQD
jgi:3-oxoacyl-[acyl-carrier-protein] synthase III